MAALSKEMRLLANSWAGAPWPKHLEWIEIDGLRGWRGERVAFDFPLVAIVGENGTGKSTVLQAIASSYRPANGYKAHYPSDFFPDSPWETVSNVTITCSVREGGRTAQNSVRKGEQRWRGYDARPQRFVTYLDLRRMQPIVARPSFMKLARRDIEEDQRAPFDPSVLERLSAILGRSYTAAAYSNTKADAARWVPVLGMGATEYSGFHQGAGESVVADLLRASVPQYGMLLIDEIETSLHPRAQRRLVRDLAALCRQQRLQIVFTTHSPSVLAELPEEARLFLRANPDSKQILRGVSEEFAFTMMDDERHPEFDVFVEDDVARVWLTEVLAATRADLLNRCQIIAFGAAGVGRALGQMVEQQRFPRRSAVVLDADQEPAPGCAQLPGSDAPERVVFADLEAHGWPNVADQLGRSHAMLLDAARRAMTQPDHHDWLRAVGDQIHSGAGEVWSAMCRSWVRACGGADAAQALLGHLEVALLT